MGLGSMLTAFQGDPKFRRLSTTLNVPLQTRLNASLKDFDFTKSAGALDVASFISKYLSEMPAAEGRADEEIGNIDQYFNGGLSGILGGLRTNRSAAVKAAGDQALAYGTRSRNMSVLDGGGSGSSYDKRLGIQQGNDILIRNALDASDQERNDLDFIEKSKLNLTGQRQAIRDAVLSRILTPDAVRREQDSKNMNWLAGFQDINNKNHIYGVQKKSTGLDRWGNFLNATDDTAAQGMSAYGAMAEAGSSGGGGGSM